MSKHEIIREGRKQFEVRLGLVESPIVKPTKSKNPVYLPNGGTSTANTATKQPSAGWAKNKKKAPSTTKPGNTTTSTKKEKKIVKPSIDLSKYRKKAEHVLNTLDTELELLTDLDTVLTEYAESGMVISTVDVSIKNGKRYYSINGVEKLVIL